MERVQDISESDAIAEGIQAFEVGYPRSTGEPYVGYVTEYGVRNWIPSNRSTAVLAYRDLWNEINAKRGYGWEEKPWVWSIHFRRIKDGYGPSVFAETYHVSQLIDTMKKTNTEIRKMGNVR